MIWMSNMKKVSVRKLVLVAILTSMCFVIGLVESFIPSVGVPGVKLGLSNIIILVTLYELGIWEAFFVSISRVLLVSLVRGTFLSMGFTMSLVGAVLSLGIMILFKLLIKQFSIMSVSVIGAIFHVIGQIGVAIIYLGTSSILYYLPIIGISAIGTGIVVGFVANSIIKTGVIRKQKERYNF